MPSVSVDVVQGLSVGFLIALGIVAVAIGAGIVTWRRNPHRFRLARFGTATVPRDVQPFIGRERELTRFRTLIVDSRPAAKGSKRRRRLSFRSKKPEQTDHADAPPALLLVSGEPGIGKHALLERFQRVCQEERRPARCGPVMDLRKARPIDEILEDVAEQLAQSPTEFRRFGDSLDRYRRAARGGPTRGQEGLDVTRDIVSLAGTVVPGVSRAGAPIQSAAAERFVERVEGGRDLNTVGDEFAQEVVSLAETRPRDRLVLLFSDLDSRPDDRDVIWLRNWLFPRLTVRPSVLIVASVGTADDLDAPELAGLRRLRPETMTLDRLDADEARRFVTEVIGLEENTLLTEAIVSRSAGMVERLQGYRRLIQRNPHLRDADALPEDADEWASGGLTYSLLRELPSRFLAELVVCSSPLRWFNAALLNEVAQVANLDEGTEVEQKAEAQEPTRAQQRTSTHSVPSALIRSGTRPSWITSRGGGWGIADADNRRAFVAEFRRLDPMLFRRVHELAAKYHRGRLTLTGAPPVDESAEDWLFSDFESPSDAFDNAEYVSALAEWLYHLLALNPERAFPVVVRNAAEALFARAEAAQRVIPVDPELDLPARQRLYLDLLARAANTFGEEQPAEAIRVLEQLVKAGEPAPLVRPVALHLLGQLYWNNDDCGRATTRFERAEKLLEPLKKDRQALRVSCWNTSWLAFGLTLRDGAEMRALERLDKATKIAEGLRDPGLTAELARTRGLVQHQARDAAAAEASYREALHAFQEAGKPESIAPVRLNLATLYLDEGRHEDAAAALDDAAGLYSYLADYKSRAEVELYRARLAFRRGDPEEAERHVAEARRLRPGDASVENGIGLVYFDAAGESAKPERLYARAHDCFDAAFKLAKSNLYRRNAAHALIQVGRLDDSEKIFQELLASSRDSTTLLRYAELKFRRDDRARARELYDEVKRKRMRRVLSDRDRAGTWWALGDLHTQWAAIASRDAQGRLQAYREAEGAFAEASELEPAEPGYVLRRCECLLALGEAERAVDLLQETARRAPGRKSVIETLASAIQGLHDPDQALRSLRAARKRARADRALIQAYRPLLEALGFEAALEELDAEIDDYPEEPELHFLRAEFARARARPAALDADRFEIAPPPRSAVAATTTRRDSQLARDREGVLDGLLRACELGTGENAAKLGIPVEPQITYLLAVAEHQIERRNWDEARRAAGAARDLDPSNTRVAATLQRIRFGDSWRRTFSGTIQPLVTPIEVEVPEAILPWVEIPGAEHLYDKMLPEMRRALQERWGFQFPGVRVRWNSDLPVDTVVVYLREIPRYSFTTLAAHLAGPELGDAGFDLSRAIPALRPWDGGPGWWIPDDAVREVIAAGIPIWNPRGVIVATVQEILERHATEFLSLQEVARLMRDSADGDGAWRQHLPLVTTLARRLATPERPATNIVAAAHDVLDGNGYSAGDFARVEDEIRRRLSQPEREGLRWPIR
jgi:tetratricopeptide (TPR) repeat protein